MGYERKDGKMKTKKYWMGEITVCDICQKPFGKYFIDGKTAMGPWGLMCEDCHCSVGCGLGLGLGQKYLTKTKEKVEG